jgi:hypothetical protein
MRESLRDGRLVLDYEFWFDDIENAQAESLFRSNITGDWLVPIWSEVTLLAPIAPGATSIPANTSADYREGGLAFLDGPDGYEVATIDSVGAGLTLDTATTVTVTSCAPLHLAFALSSLGGRRMFRGLSRRAIRFQVRDNADLADTAFPQFVDIDVLTDPTVIVASIEASVTQAREFIDNGMGLVAVEPTRDVTEARSVIRFIDATPESRWARKRWFHHLRGRDTPFWLPTWADDLMLAETATSAQTFIDVDPLEGEPEDLAGRAIMIEDDTGQMYRTITAAEAASENWRLSVAPLGRDVSEATISFMTRMRLDTDRVEFAVTGAAYMETTAAVVEVPA